MAPSGRRRARSSRISRRTQIKKLVDQSKSQEKSAISPIKNSDRVLKIIKKQEKSAISPIKNSNKVLKIIKKQEEKSPINDPDKVLKIIKTQEKCAVSPIKNLLKIEGGDFTNGGDDDIGCSTPKGKRFRLPEIVTCPPAPMKRRMVTNNCSLRRTPISFFTPPDLELFFVFALGRRDVSV